MGPVQLGAVLASDEVLLPARKSGRILPCFLPLLSVFKGGVREDDHYLTEVGAD